MRKKRFDNKVDKYRHCQGINSDDHVIPLIIGYDGIIYHESAKMLDDITKEITPQMLYKVIYREIALSWKKAEELINRKMRTAIDDGRFRMNVLNNE